jgi:hypothetical protein
MNVQRKKRFRDKAAPAKFYPALPATLLVATPEQRRRHIEADRLGGMQIELGHDRHTCPAGETDSPRLIRSASTFWLGQSAGLHPVGLAQNSLRYRPAAAKEHDMPEPTRPAADAASTTAEDQPIRDRVKELTSQVLQQGRVDPEAVRGVVSAVLGRPPGGTEGGAKVREFFADAVRQLDDALMKSASAAHSALQQLASRGQDFTDNDLKEALVSLRKLEEDYVAIANRLGEAMSANLRHEMTELAAHAQNLGVEASVRVASMMGEFANSMGAASGLATVRGASVRMATLASGVLAGIADALRDQSEAKKGK